MTVPEHDTDREYSHDDDADQPSTSDESAETAPLRAVDLTHTYGSVTVLENVSLEIPAGSVTGLIGPNGCGKTTLLRILTGVLSPTSGSVQYRGPDTVRQIGYLPQQPAFRPGFTTAETLTFYASLVGVDEQYASAALERVGLEAAAEQPVEALSGGMTRLLGIAQATIGDPPVVILDEPESGLDPGMSVRLFDIATELAAGGTAVLLSSHDLALLERSVDRVALLDRGQIRQYGTPEELCGAREKETLLEVYEATVSDPSVVRIQGETT